MQGSLQSSALPAELSKEWQDSGPALPRWQSHPVAPVGAALRTSLVQPPAPSSRSSEITPGRSSFSPGAFSKPPACRLHSPPAKPLLRLDCPRGEKRFPRCRWKPFGFRFLLLPLSLQPGTPVKAWLCLLNNSLAYLLEGSCLGARRALPSPSWRGPVPSAASH